MGKVVISCIDSGLYGAFAIKEEYLSKLAVDLTIQIIERSNNKKLNSDRKVVLP